MRFALALLGAAIASGAAFAGAAGVNTGVQPVISCIHNGNSQLRVVGNSSDCGNDTVVSWNAIVGSPAGGGQVGDVFTTSQGLVSVRIPSEEFRRVLSLTLPAGSYALSAKVEVGSEAGAAELSVRCTLVVSGIPNGDAAETDVTSSAPVQTLPLQFVATIAAPAQVELGCQNLSHTLDSAGATIFAGNGELTALVVGTVHTQK